MDINIDIYNEDYTDALSFIIKMNNKEIVLDAIYSIFDKIKENEEDRRYFSMDLLIRRLQYFNYDISINMHTSIYFEEDVVKSIYIEKVSIQPSNDILEIKAVRRFS